MEEERQSSKDRLLVASGLQKAKAPQTPEEKVEQMERLFNGMMEDVRKAVVLASQAQGRGESMIESLKKYCKDTLPKQLVQAIDEAAEQGVRDSLKPLDEEVGRAVAEIKEMRKAVAADLEGCRKTLADKGWNRALELWVFALTMGVAMGILVRCQFVGDKIDENKRYEVWGRKVEQAVEKYNDAKGKKKFYDDVGGRP